MARECEVCATVEAPCGERSRRRKLRRLLIEERIVALCDEHASEAQLHHVATLDELRALFREGDSGRRSLVPRRAVLDRRVFPPRPEGRRHNEGRRTSDQRQ
jgi:hypothetical protein